MSLFRPYLNTRAKAPAERKCATAENAEPAEQFLCGLYLIAFNLVNGKDDGYAKEIEC
jgi:hypothetical protein